MSDWNQRYKQSEHTTDVPHPLIVEFASTAVPGRALDVACGVGRHAIFLAELGWNVTAVDASGVAIEILRQRAEQKGVWTNALVADLERDEFTMKPNAYDLIVVCHYLQRDLFAHINNATRIGGCVIAIIAMVDSSPGVKPMNPAYLLDPGELRTFFKGWELIHDFEGKAGDPRRRAEAEIIARKT